MKFKRGNIILAALPDDYGKPRSCLVLQVDLFDDLPSITFCMLTSTLGDDHTLARINIKSDGNNGLNQGSQIAIDKIITLPKLRVTRRIGTADDVVMLQVTRALTVFLGIG